MDKIKEALAKNKCGSLAITVTLIMASLYCATASFSALGLVCFVLINLAVFFIVERNLFKDYNLLFNKKAACVLALIGIVTCVLSLLAPAFIDNVISLSILVLIVAVTVGISYAGNIKDKTSKIFIALTIFGLGFAALYIVYTAGAFSPDSYMYYDISKTTFNDYGNTGIIRQYIIDSIYNCSFPYFYPLCLFIVDRLTGLGLYSGVLIDIYAMLFTLLLITKLSRRITSKARCGLIAFVVLVTSPFYLDEVCGGRPIPVSLLLIIIILGIFYSLFTIEKDSLFRAPVLGLVVGLAAVTRFDNLPLTAYCFLVLLFVSRKKIRDIVLYLCGMLISVSPWIVYSLVRFNKPWITDNSGTLFLVNYALPTRVDLPGEKAPTLFSDPGMWFGSLFTTKILITFGLIICSLAGFICFIFCCYWLFGSIKEKTATLANSKMFLVILLFYFLKTGMYVVVGYPEERYHLETIFIMTFVLLAYCFNRRKKINLNPVMIAIVPATLLTLVIYLSFYGSMGFPDRTSKMVSGIKNGDMDAVTANSLLSRIDVPEDSIAELNDELKGLLKDDEAVLVVESYYKLEVWADYKVYAHPYPNNSDTIDYVVSTHPDIRYVAARGIDADIGYFASKYPARPVGDYYIFDVRRAK